MIIGTYSGGSASAYEYSTFPELLSQLPDNTGNLIDAINVRNSVYTLWQRVSQVQNVASQSASASTTYTNSNPTPLPIFGIPPGSTFNNKTMTEMWNDLLYPYTPPSATLTLSGGNPREFGSSNTVTLNWSVTKGSKNITSIIVTTASPNPAITPTNSAVQSGTKNTFATLNTDTTFSMGVTDVPSGTSSISAQTTVNWSSAVYWGRTTTFTPPTMNNVGGPSGKPGWADGAGVGLGKTLSSSRAANYSGIDGAGQYLVFAWPTAYGEPSFTVNGVINTAFTKIWSGLNYSNGYGYQRSYDVWITNTAQNSPIDSFIIS
jgi:hypothetical protein